MVSDKELANPNFVHDVRALAHALDIKGGLWRTLLLDAYRDYAGIIVDDSDRETFVNTSVFEDEPNDDRWRTTLPESSIRAFFRTYTVPLPTGTKARYTPLSRERFRAMATILRAQFPSEAVLWGVRAANDNEKAQ